jgi:hypothetical protein
MPFEITLASLGKLVVGPSIKAAVATLRKAVHDRDDRVVEEQMRVLIQVISVSSDEDALNEATAALTQGDPRVDELLVEWQKAILDAILPGARVYLTFLFAKYLAQGATADPFLRRTGKMLRDIDEQELDCMTLFLSAVAKSSQGLPPRFASLAEGRTNLVASDGTTFEVNGLDARPAARILASARLLAFEREQVTFDDDLSRSNLCNLIQVFGRRTEDIKLVPSSRTGARFPAMSTD